MLCGIDEAGRGALAGPLVVAGAILHDSIVDLNDSKKLTAPKREKLFKQLQQHATYHIVFIDNKELDTIGISNALRYAIKEIQAYLKASEYLFDGNTTLGIKNLKNLIKADTQIPEVMAASILAKVARDRYMIARDADYPEYHFATHKGYGTKKHIEAIKAFGESALHRKSFKIKSLQLTLF